MSVVLPGTVAQLAGSGPPLRVTFDSNAWEKVFDPNDHAYEPLRAALADGRIEGFICETGFRIEAITKRQRPAYFAQPFTDMPVKIVAKGGSIFEMIGSIGPDDSKHPGLPDVQAQKLHSALTAGVKIMRGLAWMGLPRPPQLAVPNVFVAENEAESRARQDRQHWADFQINSRGVGKAAFDAADGWTERERTPTEERQLVKACAEWADGELVAAHIGYQNQILCTDDHARGAGVSIFDAGNRAWLSAEFAMVFKTLDELMAMV